MTASLCEFVLKNTQREREGGGIDNTQTTLFTGVIVVIMEKREILFLKFITWVTWTDNLCRIQVVGLLAFPNLDYQIKLL